MWGGTQAGEGEGQQTPALGRGVGQTEQSPLRPAVPLERLPRRVLVLPPHLVLCTRTSWFVIKWPRVCLGGRRKKMGDTGL